MVNAPGVPSFEDGDRLLKKVREPTADEVGHCAGRRENRFSDGGPEGGLGGACAVGGSDGDREFGQQLADLGGARHHFSFAGRDDKREELLAGIRHAGRVADGGEDGEDVVFFVDRAGTVFGIVQFEAIFGDNSEHGGRDVAFRLGDEKKGEQVQQLEVLLGRGQRNAAWGGRGTVFATESDVAECQEHLIHGGRQRK